jgi:hypothetical protein
MQGAKLLSKVNNKYIFNCKINHLINNCNFKLPIFQRLEDTLRVDDIVTYQTKLYNNTDKYMFTGCIELALINNTINILDGQHRISAMKILVDTYPDRCNYEVLLIVYELDTEIESRQIYDLINKAKEGPYTDNLNNNTINTVKEITMFFTDKYPKLFVNSKTTAYRPKINLNQFQENIGIIIQELSILDTITIIDMIETINTLYSTHTDYDEFFDKKNKIPNCKFFNKCRENGGLYLSLRAEWYNDIIALNGENLMQHLEIS